MTNCRFQHVLGPSGFEARLTVPVQPMNEFPMPPFIIQRALGQRLVSFDNPLIPGATVQLATWPPRTAQVRFAAGEQRNIQLATDSAFRNVRRFLSYPKSFFFSTTCRVSVNVHGYFITVRGLRKLVRVSRFSNNRVAFIDPDTGRIVRSLRLLRNAWAAWEQFQSFAGPQIQPSASPLTAGSKKLFNLGAVGAAPAWRKKP